MLHFISLSTLKIRQVASSDSQIDTTAAQQTDTNYKLDIWLLGHWRQLLGHFTLQQLATETVI